MSTIHTGDCFRRDGSNTRQNEILGEAQANFLHRRFGDISFFLSRHFSVIDSIHNKKKGAIQLSNFGSCARKNQKNAHQPLSSLPNKCRRPHNNNNNNDGDNNTNQLDQWDRNRQLRTHTRHHNVVRFTPTIRITNITTTTTFSLVSVKHPLIRVPIVLVVHIIVINQCFMEAHQKQKLLSVFFFFFNLFLLNCFE